MKALADLLKDFNPEENHYISREFQSFGIHLAEKLNDSRRKALYIKYAKYIPRPILEEALRFVVDSNAKSKGALFMWKLKELKVFEKYAIPPRGKKKKPGIPTPRSRRTSPSPDATTTKPTPKKTVRRRSSPASPAQQRLDLPDSA